MLGKKSQQYECIETKTKIKEYIDNLIKKGDSSYIRKLNKWFPDVMKYINKNYPSKSMKQSVYNYINDVIIQPTHKL